MENKKKKPVGACKRMNKPKLVLIFVAVILAAFLSGYAVANLTTQTKIGNFATIKTVGLTIYSDQNCTQQLTQIQWGILEPNSSKTIICFAKSTSNTAITVTVTTQNWDPANSPQYMTLTATPNNFSLNPSQTIQVALTLTIAENVTSITNFSFDITFNGSG
jgi:hypothetical protein